MLNRCENIDLFRNKQKFKACIALIQGKLDELSCHTEMLHTNEKLHYNLFENDRKKESYLLGRLSAKHAVINCIGKINPDSICIENGVFQFPVIKCVKVQNIQVSIAHCDGIGISIAFPEEHPMSIDIEMINCDSEDEILSQVSYKEKSLLRNIDLDNITGFTSIWSIKESLSKVIKTGMMIDFELLEIDSVNFKNDVLESTFKNFGQYKCFTFINKQFVISIISPKKTSVDFKSLGNMLNSIKVDER